MACENNTYSRPLISAGDFDPKVRQSDIVFGAWSGFISLVGLRMQDYKSLCAAATICATMTHRQTDSILTSLYEQPSQLS